jgi:hypothetical protein
VSSELQQSIKPGEARRAKPIIAAKSKTDPTSCRSQLFLRIGIELSPHLFLQLLSLAQKINHCVVVQNQEKKAA